MGIAHHPVHGDPAAPAPGRLAAALLPAARASWIGWFGLMRQRAGDPCAVADLRRSHCIPLAYTGGPVDRRACSGWICAGPRCRRPVSRPTTGRRPRLYSLVAIAELRSPPGPTSMEVLDGQALLPPGPRRLARPDRLHAQLEPFLAVGYGVRRRIAFARDKLKEGCRSPVGSRCSSTCAWLPTRCSSRASTLRRCGRWCRAFHALLLAPGASAVRRWPFTAIVLAGGVGRCRDSVRNRSDPARRIRARWRPSSARAVLNGLARLRQISPAWTTRYSGSCSHPADDLCCGALRPSWPPRHRLTRGRLRHLDELRPARTSEKARAIMAGRGAWRSVPAILIPPRPIPSKCPGAFATTSGPATAGRATLGACRRLAGDGLARRPDADPARHAGRRPRARARVPSGRAEHLVVVSPVIRGRLGPGRSRWTREVYLTSWVWTRDIARDPRFRQVEYRWGRTRSS